MPSVYFTEDDMCTTQKLGIKRVQDWFVANDWSVSTDPEQSDLAIVLTCAGWSKLVDNSLDRIHRLAHLGEDRLAVVGCVNDANPERVSEIFSGRTFATRTLEETIEALIPDARVPLSDIPHASEFRSKADYRLYDLTKRYVNIAAGCSFSCSFCTHKPGLGELRSRTPEDILGQIRELAKGDLRIVALMGMETAYYGRDIGSSYPELLEAVLELGGDFEINVAQFNPVGVTKYHDRLLPLFQTKRITDIQMPIQTTSQRLLKMMYRPPVTREVGSFLKKVREKNTRVVLRTDIIVGFATETMEELEDTLAFVVEVFDEVAVYALEIYPELPAIKYKHLEHSPEELQRRVKYATEYIERHGLMAHGGQQADVDLIDVEKRKEEMRRSRGTCTSANAFEIA